MEEQSAVSKSEGELGEGSKGRTSSNPKEDEVNDIKGNSTGEEKAAEISKPQAAAGSGDGAVHPLLIDHVIEKIFQHIICPKTAEGESSKSVAKNVQNLRLVCKQWKDIATRLYRRNRAPMIEFGMWGLKDWTAYEYPDVKLQNFLGVMKTSDLIPIQRYRFVEKFFVMGNVQLMEDFMRVCGPDAVEMELYCYHDYTMKFTRESFPDLNLKGLKKLMFWGVNAKTNEIAYLIDKLLSAAETLQEFQFNAYYTCGQLPQAIIQQFRECMSKRLPKTVKILSFNLPLNDLHLNTLMEGELKLKELKIKFDVKSGGASSKVIRKFFEKQTATLKDLTIYDEHSRFSSSVSLDFPRFDELLNLELEGGVIQPFSFPDTFPKLITLNMRKWKIESTCVELFSSGKKGLSLKEIRLPYHFRRQAPLLKKVGMCFPNISKLGISLTEDISETFQEVFVYLPNLEELNLTFRYDDESEDDVVNADSIFSGVSELDWKRIMKRTTIEDGFDNVDIAAVQHRPSMLSLTKLKKLALEPESILTDFAAHFVFLKMDSLKEIYSIEPFRMSAKYLDLLREKLNLVFENNY